MWKKKDNRKPDERISSESNAFSAKMYYVITALTILSLVVKAVYSLPLSAYMLEFLALAASAFYIVAAKAAKGLLFVTDRDNVLQIIHEEILSKAFMIMFYIFIFGELIFIFVWEEHIAWIFSYVVIWFIPCLIILIKSIHNGWLIWGSKKKETDGKKAFRIRTAIGALFFGIFVGFKFVFHDGIFDLKGILWILCPALGWGIAFYFIFLGIMKVSEKKADEKLTRETEDIEK